jgi:dolichol-phosphate mannosyltransferase
LRDIDGGEASARDGAAIGCGLVRAVVLLPTFNEADNIALLLAAVRSEAPDADVVVIDDSSPDGTGQIAQCAADDDPRITVVHRSGKAGLGAAYRHGFELAFAAGYDVIVSMDSDFSHDPQRITALVGVVAGGADLAIGSRYVDDGGTVDWPLRRRLLSRWGNRYTAKLLGVRVRDCTSGFRAYRASALQAVGPAGTTAEGYAFLTELVRRLAKSGATIAEVPILFKDRERGTSKMSGRIIAESMLLVTGWGIKDRTNAARSWTRSLRSRSR